MAIICSLILPFIIDIEHLRVSSR